MTSGGDGVTHEEFVQNVMLELTGQHPGLEEIQAAIHCALHGISLLEECKDLITVDEDKRGQQLRRFLACKMVEGCTEKTMRYYDSVMKRFMVTMPKPFEQVTIDDIRYYIAIRGTRDKLSKISQDNELRVLKSFYGWASTNDVCVRDPAHGVKCIKTEKRVKKPFSPEEQELLRVACRDDLRTTALLEVLLSTGCRVGEIVGMSRSDLNGDEIVVFGKGQKERRAYINARARVALQLYLDSRWDDSEGLFVSDRSPHEALGITGIQRIISDLGKKAGIRNVHPHRFRRTAATTALQRGMPIEQVQQMLGHESIGTTLIYAKIADDSVKQTHKRLM